MNHTEKDAIYRAIYTRRDVRREFLPTPIPNEVLARILCAAHHAPSVGLSQPWHFTVIQNQGIKRSVFELFEHANNEAATLFPKDKQDLYRSLKLEGILDAPINLCVSCDRRSTEPVLGRTHQPDTDLYSTACAVQNLWLAAKAEDVGVGWVSIVNEDAVRTVLNIPEQVIPVAYLCVGYVSEFHQTPDLIRAKWSQRQPLQNRVSFDQFEAGIDDVFSEALVEAMQLRKQLI